MPAMTMPYKVKDAKEFDGHRRPAISSTPRWSSSVERRVFDRTSRKSARRRSRSRPDVNAVAASELRLLKPGEPVPDASLRRSGRQGRARSAPSKVAPSSMTFIYTTCPLPTFCPLMDRNFAAIQKKLKSRSGAQERAAGSVSFDPDHRHAAGARRSTRRSSAPTRRSGRSSPAIATTSTGSRRSFGVSIVPRTRREERDRHHAQPANRHRRSRGQADEDLHRQRVDPRAGAGGHQSS